MQLIYASGELFWMTGVLLVGVVYAILAFVWGRNK